jgi:hypothetical protein
MIWKTKKYNGESVTWYSEDAVEKYKTALKNILDGNIGKCCCPEEYAKKVLKEVKNG